MGRDFNDVMLEQGPEAVRQALRIAGPVEPLRSRLHVLDWPEISFSSNTDYLIKGVISAGETSVNFGEPGCGKSFLKIDMDLHVSMGCEWFGRRVNQAGVIYIASEGGAGLGRRIEAFKNIHGPIDHIPFGLLPASVDLLDPSADVQLLLAECERMAAKWGQPVKLITVDTLARSFGGGDENSSADMGAFIANCDRLRQATGAHISIVHHMPKAGQTPRGHSSLLGAADTVIHVEREQGGIRTATITKQKDGADGDQFAFSLNVVELGTDQDGDPITSCVVQAEDAPDTVPKLSPQTEIALKQLHSAMADAGETAPASNHIPRGTRVVPLALWKGYCEQSAMGDRDNRDSFRRTFNRARQKLESIGVIGTWSEHIWIVSNDRDNRDKVGQ